MSRRLIDIVTLAAVVVLVMSLCASLTGRYVLDIDDINLLLGIEHFDLRMHQPHPPGYLGYVLVLRALHAVVGGAPTRVALLAARGFSILTLLFVWRAALRLGADAVRARLAVLVVACNPIVLYYAVDGQTHAAEGAMAAALVWALADARRPWLVGLLVAAGGSFRPTYLLLAGPAVLWVYRRDWRGLAVVAALAVAGTVAWLVPTAYLTGGWAAYRAANDALVGEFVSHVSLLSPTSSSRFVELNLRDTFAWALIALAPLAVAARRVEGRVAWIALLADGPALAFYAVVLCAEAGYLAGLVAPAVLLAAVAARRGWHFGLVAAVELAFFLFAPRADRPHLHDARRVRDPAARPAHRRALRRY